MPLVKAVEPPPQVARTQRRVMPPCERCNRSCRYWSSATMNGGPNCCTHASDANDGDLFVINETTYTRAYSREDRRRVRHVVGTTLTVLIGALCH